MPLKSMEGQVRFVSDVVDRLEVKVEAEAQGANKQLDKLVGNLEKVSSSLGAINAGGLQGLANGVQKLSNSMLGMKNVKTTDFTSLTKNIGKLGAINTTGLNSAASSMIIMGKSLSGLGKVSENAVQLGELSKSISKLGNKGVANAITNIPQLADALNKMMGTLSRSPQVNKNLIQMTNSLANLASQGSKVSSATKSINSSFKLYSSATDRATKSSKSFASAVGMLYARFWMLKRAAQAMFKSVESSMDFLETVNYFEVVVGKIGKDSAGLWQENGYNSAEEYVNSFSGRLKELTSKMTGFEIDSDGNTTMPDMNSLGMNPDKVMQNQAVYAQMADSLGLCGETAINTSKAFTMLGADWASLRNISLDTAWEKFASAMAGQSRAVRSLGIDITMATLQETAYKYGLTQAVQEMNQATKAQLRLLTIMNQSTVAFGDMANTIQSPANQLRILQQNFANLSRIIGNLFLPVIAKVLPYINGLVIAMQRLFTWVGGLLGIKFDSINSAIGGAGDGIGDVVGGVGDLEEGLEDANAAAKKLKTTTLGIDELNINAPQEDSGGKDTPVGGGNPILDGAIADALAEYEKVWNDAFNRMDNKAKEIADNIANYFGKMYDAAEPFRESLKRLWNEGFLMLASYSFEALKDFYNEFLVPLGKWAFGTEGQGLTRLVDVINNSLLKIDWLWITENLKEFWKAIEPYAEQFGEGLIDFFEDASGIAVDVINKLFGKDGLLKSITDSLNKGDPTKARDWGYAFGQVALGIIAFKLAFKGFTAIEAGIALFDRFKKIGEWLAGTTVGTMISKLPSLSTVLMGFANALSYIGMASPAMLPALFDKLGQEFPKLADAFSWFTDPKGILKIINDWLFDIVDGIANTVKGIPGAIKEIFNNTFNWDSTFALFSESGKHFSEVFDGNSIGKNIVLGIGKGIFGAIGFIIEPIGDFFVGIWDAFCGILGIHSPAAEMYPIGENILLGVVEGFKGAFSFFTDAITLWWTESVAPWFTLEQWSLLFSNILLSFQTKWQEIKDWWNSSALVLWWEEDVAKWFTIEQWSGIWNNVKTAFSTKWNEIKAWWKTSALALWWKEDIAPWFTLNKWLTEMSKIPEAFGTTFKNAINVTRNIINSLIDWVNENLKFEWDIKNPFNGETISSGSQQLFKIPHIPQFATGGVVTRSTFAQIGENGREAVVPLENNTGWIKKLSFDIMGNMQNMQPTFGTDFMPYESSFDKMQSYISDRSYIEDGSHVTDGLYTKVEESNKLMLETMQEQNSLLKNEIELLKDIYAKEMIVSIGDRDIVQSYDRGVSRMGLKFSPA